MNPDDEVGMFDVGDIKTTASRFGSELTKKQIEGLKGFRKDQGRDPENLEMILIRQEAGNKAKEADKVIEVQFGKSFGEEVDDLIKSGDV